MTEEEAKSLKKGTKLITLQDLFGLKAGSEVEFVEFYEGPGTLNVTLDGKSKKGYSPEIFRLAESKPKTMSKEEFQLLKVGGKVNLTNPDCVGEVSKIISGDYVEVHLGQRYFVYHREELLESKDYNEESKIWCPKDDFEKEKESSSPWGGYGRWESVGGVNFDSEGQVSFISFNKDKTVQKDKQVFYGPENQSKIARIAKWFFAPPVAVGKFVGWVAKKSNWIFWSGIVGAGGYVGWLINNGLIEIQSPFKF